MILPIEKQFEIWDLLALKKSMRYIANQVHVSKTTLQDYKKRGIPFYRKHLRNTPTDMYPASWPEERKWFIQKIEDLKKRETQHTDEVNKANMKVEDIKQEKNKINQELTIEKEKNKETEYYKKKYEEQKEEVQKLKQDMENKKQKCISGLQKIDTAYRDLEKQRDFYKNKFLKTEEKNRHLEEKLQQKPDSNQEIQTTKEATTVNGDMDNTKRGVDWPLVSLHTTATFLKALSTGTYKPKKQPPIK